MQKPFLTQEPGYFTDGDYQGLLQQAYACDYSDITIQTGCQVLASKDGRVHALTTRALGIDEVESFANLLYGSNAVAKIMSGSDLDFSYVLLAHTQTKIRFRVNLTTCYFHAATGIQASLRLLPSSPVDLKNLLVPASWYDLSLMKEGIILVCGSTGSGKSTLLSSMLQYRLDHNTQGEKLITMESPIECLYRCNYPTNSSVSQTELPRQLPNYAYAVRNALRRTPTAVMVGEARDQETLSAVIEAALTGHAVFTTLHSKSVAEAISRGLMMFPQDQKKRIQYDLLHSSSAIIWQTLIPSQKGGRVALRESLSLCDQKRRILSQVSDEQFTSTIQYMLKEDKTDKVSHAKELHLAGHISSEHYQQIAIAMNRGAQDE